MLCFKHHLAQRTLLKWSPLVFFLSSYNSTECLIGDLSVLPSHSLHRKNCHCQNCWIPLSPPPALHCLNLPSWDHWFTSYKNLLNFCLQASRFFFASLPDAVHTPKHTAPLSAINYPGMLLPTGRSSVLLLPCTQNHSFFFALCLTTWIGQMPAFCFQSAKQVSVSTSCFSTNLANSSYFNFLLPVTSRRTSLCMTSGHWLVF